MLLKTLYGADLPEIIKSKPERYVWRATFCLGIAFGPILLALGHFATHQRTALVEEIQVNISKIPTESKEDLLKFVQEVQKDILVNHLRRTPANQQ